MAEKTPETNDNKTGDGEKSDDDAVFVSWEDGSQLLAYLTADKLRDKTPDIKTPGTTAAPTPVPVAKTSTTLEKKKPEWTFEAIELFLVLMRAKYLEFDTHVTKKTVWRSIACEMFKRGYKFTDMQVSKKWLNMMESYRRIHERHAKLGVPKSHWQYYDRIQQILALKDDNLDIAANPPSPVLASQSPTPSIVSVVSLAKPTVTTSQTPPSTTSSPTQITNRSSSDNHRPTNYSVTWSSGVNRGVKRKIASKPLEVQSQPSTATAILKAIEDLRDDRRNMFNTLASLMRQKIQVSREMAVAIRDIANCKKKRVMDGNS